MIEGGRRRYVLCSTLYVKFREKKAKASSHSRQEQRRERILLQVRFCACQLNHTKRERESTAAAFLCIKKDKKNNIFIRQVISIGDSYIHIICTLLHSQNEQGIIIKVKIKIKKQYTAKTS